MEKRFTAFEVNKGTGILTDANFNRFETEQEVIDDLKPFNDYDTEYVVLPIFVPKSLLY